MRPTKGGPFTMNVYEFDENEVFKASSFLREKCGQLSSWMEVYTFDDKQGLKKDGTVAVLSQTLQSLTRLDNTFQVIIETLKEIFQKDYLSDKNYESVASYNTVAIETRMDDFQKYINLNLDENLVENDRKYQTYRNLQTRLQRIKDSYQLRLSEFTSIANRTEQGGYLQGFQDSSKIGDPSIGTLDGITSYVLSTDSSNQESLLQRITNLNNTVTDLQTQYVRISNELSSVDYRQQDPYYIQDDIEHLDEYVRSYRQRETERILEEIRLLIKNEVDPLVEFVSRQISGSLALSSGFEDTVQDRIDELNYFEYSQYDQDYRMFLTLAGKDICYYPYYNFKNIIHPSYQIHPFLWNFVEKTSSQDEIRETFYSHNVEELIDQKALLYVDQIFGEYGQVKDKWKFPNIRDFSGYTSRYEKSRHSPNSNTRFSEVVDYDGPFYPPAVDYLLSLGPDFGHAISSLVDGATRAGLVNYISDLKSVRSAFSSEPPSETSLLSVISDLGYVSEVTGIGTDQISAKVLSFFLETETGVRTINGFAEYILHDVENTFYERFYGHLDLDADQRRYVADQLSAYFLDPPQGAEYTTVRDIVAENSGWDIYNYGEDRFGNMYILYKNYGKDDPTYQEKKNTPGILWIRIKDNPIAFPAFAGQFPNVSPEGINNAISRSERPDFDEYYDFSVSKDLTQISLVARNLTDGVESGVQTYENPWIIMTPIEMSEDGPVIVKMTHDPDLVDYIESGWGYDRETTLCSIVEQPTVSYRYLGPFVNGDDDTAHLYVLNSYALSGNQLSDSIRIITTRDCTIYGTHDIPCDFSDQVSDQISFGKYADGGKTHIAVSYVGRNNVGTVSSESSLDESVELSSNTSGLPTTSPARREDVTSHDIYDGDIRILDFIINESGSEVDESRSGGRFNTNADMSYIPSYPGYENRINLLSVDPGRNAYSVEFLGKTGDLEGGISRTAISVNPYIDEDEMNANGVFGRVYEDWSHEWARKNRTIMVERCGMMNVGNQTGSAFRWTIDLDPEKLGNYLSDLTKVKFMMMNTTNLGKNPYIVADLSSLSAEPVKAFYTAMEGSGSGTSLSGAEEIGVNATPNPLDNVDMGSNRIRGIVGISAQLVLDGDDRIVVDFEIPPTIDDEGLQYVHIDEGKVQVILFNDSDISLFEKYHVFDPYGFLCILSASKDQIRRIARGIENDPDDGRGWGIYYRIPDPEDEQEAQELVKEYVYWVQNGGTAGFMEDLQLSDFSDLSDVYVFQGWDRLSFKYSEENVFGFGSDQYYFPVTNRKYPKTLAKAVRERAEKNLMTVEESKLGFRGDNTYVLTMDDPEEIASRLGDVVFGIDRANDEQTVVVYEDYLDYDESAGMYNY